MTQSSVSGFIAGGLLQLCTGGAKEIMMVVNPAGNARKLNNQLSVVGRKNPAVSVQQSLDEMSRFSRKN